MKAILIHTYNLLPVFKMVQAFIYQLFAATQRAAALAVSYVQSLNFSWIKTGNYIFGVLREAFRDNVLSEAEMEFLLLAATGFAVAAKITISNFYRNLTTQQQINSTTQQL